MPTNNIGPGAKTAPKKKTGVSLYLAIVAMSILFSIAFGMSAVSISRIKNLNNIGNSVVAFYAAETGIERGLREATDGSYSIPHDYLDLNGNGVEGPEDATYQVQGLNPGDGNCPVTYSFCLKAKGEYKGSSRSIQVNMK